MVISGPLNTDGWMKSVSDGGSFALIAQNAHFIHVIPHEEALG
jgi:hypothetical protein